MTQIRVLLNFKHQTAETADAQIERSKAIAANGRQKHGCLQYKVYRSVTSPQHRRAGNLGIEKGLRRTLAASKKSTQAVSRFDQRFEFYPHETYVFDDGVWKPLDAEKRITAIMFA